ADADDLGRATAQANRAARKTYANVPSPSPDFDRIEPDLDRGGGDSDAPYSWDDQIEDTEQRYTPPPPPAPRTRIGSDRERAPKRPRSATVFPFKSAIAIGVVMILVGAGILAFKSGFSVSGLFKSSPTVEQPKDASTPLSKPKIPDRVGQPGTSTEQQVAPV